MKDIVIIAPYKNLYDLSKEVIEEQNYENIDVVIGDLNDGLKIAKHEVDLGTRVIISRGGTYNLLKANLSIPVVEIKLTAFDILRSYGEIKDYKTKIAIVGYKNVISFSNLEASNILIASSIEDKIESLVEVIR
jgi:hypothetical protein